MQIPNRTFEDKKAERVKLQTLVALFGASGSGKTVSALRLATGIQQVDPGEIFLIDTENKRSLHYANDFNFRHVNMTEPFGSLDYLAAINYCIGRGARTVIIDSTSHEHEGLGGYIQWHDAEAERLSGGDAKKYERVKMLAWTKPSMARQQLLATFVRTPVNLILCFRAKKTSVPVSVNGKAEVVDMGWNPIGGDAFVFEMTMSCLLYPRSNGVPTWETDYPGEKIMMKLPRQFNHIFPKGEDVQLSEDVGRQMAEWARGDVSTEPKTPDQTNTSAPSATAKPTAAPPDRIDPALLDGCETKQCPTCSYITGLYKSEDGRTRAYNKNGDRHIPKCGQPTGWDELPPLDDDDQLDDPFAGDQTSLDRTGADQLEMTA